MWVITEEQKKNIRISIQQQREHRAFRILKKEEEFAKMDKEELKEKVIEYSGLVADRRIREEVLLEFLRECLRDKKFLEKDTIDWLVYRIDENI
jgi:hypothetical protein